MCDAVTLTVAAAAMAAAGQGVSALHANAQARYQAKIADRNAAIDREAAEQSILNTREEALAHYRRVSQLKGDQRARAAANGVGLEFGTAADVLADTDLLAREDAKRLYGQGNQRTRGFDISASNNVAEAGAQRSAGKGALVSGAFNMASTVLGGAQQYKTLRRSY